MSVVSNIKDTVGGSHATGALYLVMLTFIIGDILPTPADSAFFIYSRKLREDYLSEKITPKEYWTRIGISYYLFSAVWWILVFGVIIAIKGNVDTKFKVLLAIISGGILISVLHNLAIKDEKKIALQQEALIPVQ